MAKLIKPPVVVDSISIMRVMSMSSLVVGAAIALIGLLDEKNLADLAFLSSVFVVPAFGGKALQKHIETRNGVRS